MEMLIEHTAVMLAISRHVTTRRVQVNNDHFKAELSYLASLSLAERLLSSGLFTDNEFDTAKTLLLQKYSPPIGLLFASSA